MTVIPSTRLYLLNPRASLVPSFLKHKLLGALKVQTVMFVNGNFK